MEIDEEMWKRGKDGLRWSGGGNFGGRSRDGGY